MRCTAYWSGVSINERCLHGSQFGIKVRLEWQGATAIHLTHLCKTWSMGVGAYIFRTQRPNPHFNSKMAAAWIEYKCNLHTPDTLGTLPDIAANARPLRAWLKCRTITTHARESVADLSRNCNGFHVRESVHARVTEPRAQGTGVGRDIRQSPSRVRSVFLLIYGNLSFLSFK